MLQILVFGACKGSVYALVALGFGLIFTTTRVFHFAHGAIYVLASFMLYLFARQLQWPFTAALVLAVSIAVLVGMIIELVVYRPLKRKGASGVVMMISSLGVYIVIVNLLTMCFGNETKILHEGAERGIAIGPITLTHIQVWQCLAAVGLTTLYALFLRFTALGRTCRAVADNLTLASVLGVRVDATRLTACAIGAFLAAAGSILLALDVGIDPQGGFGAFMVSAVACILVGLNRFVAPALGGLLLGLLQSVAVWWTSAQWETVVVFIVLILALWVRPSGLWGVVSRVEEQ
jgi:branched-chain amino acid transport system permease protein